MDFQDSAKYSMIEFNSIYPTFGAFLNHCFLTCGNGLGWSSDGRLIDDSDQTRIAELPALERLAATGGSNGVKPPRALKYALNIERIPDNIQERIGDPFISSLCEVDPKYSRIFHLPDNVESGWLDGAIALLIIVTQTPIENYSRYSMALRDVTYEKDEAKKAKAQERLEREKESYAKCIARAHELLADLRRRFPNHQWSNPMRTIKLDSNRPDFEDAAKSWPVSGAPVENLDEIVQPFIEALKFAYNWKITSEHISDDYVENAVRSLAEHTVKYGRSIVHEKVMENWEVKLFLEKSAQSENIDPLVAFLQKEPKRTGHFDHVLDPALQNLRGNGIRFYRKNRKKDIPYKGYPIGRDSRAGCLDIDYRFQVEQMDYDLNDQGRNALEVILGSLVTVVCEQGRREYVRDLMAALAKSDFGKKVKSDDEVEIDILMNKTSEKAQAQRVALTAHINAVLDAFVFTGENATVLSEDIPTMPEVAVEDKPVEMSAKTKERLERMARLAEILKEL